MRSSMFNKAQGLSMLLLLAPFAGSAEEFRLESTGARYGFFLNGSRGDFRQAEAFVNWQLPWAWAPATNSNWRLQTRLDLSAGCLSRYDEQGFVGTAGPALVVSRKGCPFVMTGGVSPTVLSQEAYIDTDFGTPFQFTSHIGIYWRPGSRFELGYRFQHMSNAHLATSNPGLNLHMFGMGYRF